MVCRLLLARMYDTHIISKGEMKSVSERVGVCMCVFVCLYVCVCERMGERMGGCV